MCIKLVSSVAVGGKTNAALLFCRLVRGYKFRDSRKSTSAFRDIVGQVDQKVPRVHVDLGAAHCHRRLGGIGADLDNLMFMKRTADRLFGDNYQWSVMAAGAAQIPFATQAIMMGGNVRVGLEDSLFIERGKLAASNAEQVFKIRRIIEELGYEVATPDDVREMLSLKGSDKVNI